MATMLCDRDDIRFDGERMFWDASQAMPDAGIVVYHNREVRALEFDFMLLLPHRGICVVEIKGWSERSVKRVGPAGKIEVVQGDGAVRSEDPRAQARAYRFTLAGRVSAATGKRPLVFHAVCYPRLSRAFLESTGFWANCEPLYTIAREDLASGAALQSKLMSMLPSMAEWNVDVFSDELYASVRRLFEPDYAPPAPRSDFADEAAAEGPVAYPYSLLASIRHDDSAAGEKLDKLIDAYLHGSKVCAAFDTPKLHELAGSRLREALAERRLNVDGQHLLLSSDAAKLPERGPLRIFNWSSLVADADPESAALGRDWIENGEALPEDGRLLERLDEIGLLNRGQYDVEHVPAGEDVLVSAGAGTGKTAVMIDRVCYLIWRERIAPLELTKRIVMITFTNDAADNMRARLKARFQDRYLLTGDAVHLEYVSQVDRMQISTIHAYAKKLIVQMGTIAGYGRDLTVDSGSYRREKILREKLEAYVSEKRRADPKYLDKLHAPMYEIRRKLLRFIGAFSNKSVDWLSVSDEALGRCDDYPELGELFVRVARETEAAYDEALKRENVIRMDRLMPVLASLVPKAAEKLREGRAEGSAFLFIDEFQDTDDIQIKIMLKLADIRGYRMFVVGDVKQCIYRFRGADEVAFAKLGEYAPERVWTEKALRHNYRTDDELLALYDAAFSVWGAGGELTYESKKDRLDNPFSRPTGLARAEYCASVRAADEDERLDGGAAGGEAIRISDQGEAGGRRAALRQRTQNRDPRARELAGSRDRRAGKGAKAAYRDQRRRRPVSVGAGDGHAAASAGLGRAGRGGIEQAGRIELYRLSAQQGQRIS